MNSFDMVGSFQAAMDQAQLALEEKEVAIGCVFYHIGLKKIIAAGRNSVNATKNATRHAELNCIDEIIRKYNEDRSSFMPQETVLSDVFKSVLVYVTCEPCIMCARFLRHLQVASVVFGCSNDRFGGCKSVVNVAGNEQFTEEKKLVYTAGYREKETIDLLKTFYSGENLNAPEEMRKIKKPKTDTSLGIIQ